MRCKTNHPTNIVVLIGSIAYLNALQNICSKTILLKKKKKKKKKSDLKLKGYPKPHYENLSMQTTEIFSVVKIENFQLKIFNIFLIFAQNIDCGYTLEPPRRGGSNEYPQSMFWSKNKKNRYTPAYPSFTI